MAPRAGPSARGAEDPPPRGRIAREASADQPERRAAGAAPDDLGQPQDQGQVAGTTHRSAQPQAGADHQRQRQPDDPGLGLDPDLVGLDLLEVARLFDQGGLALLRGLARSGDPGLDRARLQPKGGLNGGNRTAMATRVSTCVSTAAAVRRR